MTDTRNKRRDGVHTLDDLRGRCRIDDETGCWLWAGALSRSTNRNVTPTSRVYLPRPDGSGGDLTTGQRAGWLLSGRSLKDGQVVWREVCWRHLCINPDHCRAGTRRQMHEALAASDRLKGDPRRALANAKNVERQLLPAAVVARAEAMFADGALQREVCAELGISQGPAARIRRGTHPNCAARQKLLRGASVFSWGQKP